MEEGLSVESQPPTFQPLPGFLFSWVQIWTFLGVGGGQARVGLWSQGGSPLVICDWPMTFQAEVMLGTPTGFPLDLEIMENLEKWEYTWKTWKYHGILTNLINIMEKWHETWKNLVAIKNSPLTPLKQYKIH